MDHAGARLRQGKRGHIVFGLSTRPSSLLGVSARVGMTCPGSIPLCLLVPEQSTIAAMGVRTLRTPHNGGEKHSEESTPLALTPSPSASHGASCASPAHAHAFLVHPLALGMVDDNDARSSLSPCPQEKRPRHAWLGSAW